MALRLQFLTVIVPRSAFARCRDLPDWLQALPPSGGFFLDTAWFDAHLWCETAMDGEMAEWLIARWEDAGLSPKDGGGRWKDLCLADSVHGPHGPCPWLSYDPGSLSVWLSGTEPGEIIGGTEQRQAREAQMRADEAEGEAAYTRMYDARRPKEAYEDARGVFSRALDAARFLGRPDEAERLQARLAQIYQVYDSQFRGW